MSTPAGAAQEVVRRRAWMTSVAWALAIVLAGGIAGLIAGLATPAHLQLAGTDAAVRLEVGQGYDELQFTGLLTGRRAADHTVLGEPVGVSVRLDLDTAPFIGVNGAFDPKVLPAYIQTYSNPGQVAHDVGHALVVHLLRWVGAGVAAALLAVVARRAYVGWRHRHDAHAPEGAEMRAAAIAYRAPERRLVARAALAVAVLATIAAVPSSKHSAISRPQIVPTSLLAGTPLSGAEVTGPLLPAFDAAETYIRRYFADTNTYYEQVRTTLLDQVDLAPPTLVSSETDSDAVDIGFVTDRHCNTGMDRVIVALLQRLGVSVLVSAGDDAFSGSFSFESACTAGLAAATERAHISDVFVGGNHDSPLTLADERQQGIHVLDGEPVNVAGLTFLGLPDPRTSRYGQGIRPADPELQARLLSGTGEQVGNDACHADRPVIVVLHDPRAGATALQQGCGNAVLALDGHTHEQDGPNAIALPDGSTGYTYTGASTGGAPTDKTIEHSFASSLTVGPLNHDASINILSIDPASGRLLGVTVCRITPDQTIIFEQLPMP